MKRRLTHPSKMIIVFIAVLLLSFVVMDSMAFARAGGGRSSGSRGFSSGTSSRSYQGYSATRPAQPVQQPGTTPQTPSPGMGRSLMYGLGGGLLGGMFGSMLFGGRGGWGGGGFGMGDFIIIIIILGIVYFVVKRYRARRQEMEMSSAGAGYASPYAYNEPEPAAGYGSPVQEDAVSEGLLHIMSADPAFTEAGFKEAAEDNFFRIQGAWTKRDLTPIRSLLTPQMLAAFQEQVSQAIAAKQFNRLENIAVRDVEIVDAVQDQGEEYITVKFLASLLDYTVDEATNQVVSGSTTEPVKFLEYWTFTRHVGDRNWLLAGITQEGDYQ